MCNRIIRKLSSHCLAVCFAFSVHKRFSELDPEAVSRDRNALLTKDKILDLQELRVIIVSGYIFVLV